MHTYENEKAQNTGFGANKQKRKLMTVHYRKAAYSAHSATMVRQLSFTDHENDQEIKEDIKDTFGEKMKLFKIYFDNINYAPMVIAEEIEELYSLLK